MPIVPAVPPWAFDVLRQPGGGAPLDPAGDELLAGDVPVARIERGVVCFDLPPADPSIVAYRALGGADFHARAGVAYAMSALDTAVYHGYLRDLRGGDVEAPVIDIGGGDGRNALPWLRWGHRRLVVIDPVRAGLDRFRQRVAEENADWLDRLLLIQADARRLPLATGCGGRVLAIESLYYLNDDYEIGLAEAARVLAPGGRIMLSERDWEAALLPQLLYFGGVRGMLDQAKGRDVFDGNPSLAIRSRSFTASELTALVEANGLAILSRGGISMLSIILGYLRGQGKLAEDDERHLGDVNDLLESLGRNGTMRRCHVVVAEPAPLAGRPPAC